MQRRVIPVSARGSEARMPAARQFIMYALDDKLSLWKGIVIARVIHVEMCADQHIDIARTKAKIGQMLQHIFLLLGWRQARALLCSSREPAINQDMLPIAHFGHVAGSRIMQSHPRACRQPRRRKMCWS